MARDVTAILVGTGTLYLAPIGTAFPTNPVTAPDAAFEDIGYSEEGWTIEADKTVEDVFVAELIDPVGSFKTAQTIRITGNMAQVGLEQLQFAFGGGTIATGSPAVGYDTYTPPITDEFDEFAALFRTKAPGAVGLLRDWKFPRVIAAGAISAQHTKAPTKALVALELRALVPASGAIFTVTDDTAV